MQPLQLQPPGDVTHFSPEGPSWAFFIHWVNSAIIWDTPLMGIPSVHCGLFSLDLSMVNSNCFLISYGGWCLLISFWSFAFSALSFSLSPLPNVKLFSLFISRVKWSYFSLLSCWNMLLLWWSHADYLTRTPFTLNGRFAFWLHVQMTTVKGTNANFKLDAHWQGSAGKLKF